MFRAAGTKPGQAGELCYTCNLCGQANRASAAALSREEISCFSCGSKLRQRAIVNEISKRLHGKSLALPDWPARADVRVMAMTESAQVALPLGKKLQFTNTFLHQSPKLDIAKPVEAGADLYDIIISSEVFEHVAPPVQNAFNHLKQWLRPGGFVVFTVPFSLEAQTHEHFPNLHQFEIIAEPSGRVLRNITRKGVQEKFQHLVFHGGAGDTLELRLFLLQSLRQHFIDAGFATLEVADAPCYEFGIVWNEPFSITLVAGT